MKSEFGKKLKTTITGGSHEPSVGVSIKGLPAGFEPDMIKLQAFLDRRAPGTGPLVSSRKEPDVPVLISKSTSSCGSEFSFEIRNTDIRPADYARFRSVPRPGHADYTARLRYGNEENMSGGGHFSGRMTAPLCIAGGLALQVLEAKGITVSAELVMAGDAAGPDMESEILKAKEAGDSVGGIVECSVTGLAGGIGDAMNGGLESILSEILFGIPAVKGVEFGAGFSAAKMRGSENNDAFYYDDGEVRTRTNNCGGILGGISTGMPVTFRVAFKPTPSISIPQESVDLDTGKSATLTIDGRHDPCVAVRAVPVVEAAAALGILDAILITESSLQNGQVSADAASLDLLRNEIDSIDTQLLDLFEKRMAVSKKIGDIKKQQGLPVRVSEREAAILNRISEAASPELSDSARRFFSGLFELSRDYQSRNAVSENKVYGLIGNPLGHSFSKEVHEAFGEYEFSLFDLEPEEMRAFVGSRKFDGLSVTRPYKQDVIGFCDRLTDKAAAIGAVNTLYWEETPEGRRLVGHNTDYEGFAYTASRSGIDFAGKTVLVLGSGGTSKTVCRVLEDNNAKALYFATRSGRDIVNGHAAFAYENLAEIADETEIIVNTTPVGTYPDNLSQIISVSDFPCCEAVIDVVYNPERTALVMEADALGLKTAGGMPMIVAQAAAAAGKFTGSEDRFHEKTEDVLAELLSSKRNIILIGMPGCGKTTLGRKLASASGRDFVDLDEEICRMTGRKIEDIFREDGETAFRKIETAAALEQGCRHSLVIATGGGTVLSDENYRALRQNGTFIWLKKSIKDLAREGRPLSVSTDALEAMYEQRRPLYEAWADYCVEL